MPSFGRRHSWGSVVQLNYTHFSLLFSTGRKLPMCTAVNISGKGKDIRRSKDVWKLDPAINVADQLTGAFYSKTDQAFHKGHIVRRLDPCWGSDAVAKKAEEDTFHYTNAAPQHRKFNPAIWLELERNILEKGAARFDHRLIVFAGPVLSANDKPYVKLIDGGHVFIPTHFWKIVIWQKEDKRVYAVGFMQSQKDHIARLVDHGYKSTRKRAPGDDHYEHLKFKNDAVYQVPISEIEKVTGLMFDLTGVVQPFSQGEARELLVKTKDGKRNRSSKHVRKGERLNVFGLVLTAAGD